MIPGSKTYTELAADASKTAHGYLSQAIASVNELLGDGAALKHPELVAAVMNAAAKDYAAAVVTHHLCPSLDGISSALIQAGDAIRAGLQE